MLFSYNLGKGPRLNIQSSPQPPIGAVPDLGSSRKPTQAPIGKAS